MIARRRVVVTGLGSVSAAGCGGSSAVAAALERSAETIAPLKAFTVPDCASRLAAEVDDEELMTLLNADTVRRLSRICRMAWPPAGSPPRTRGSRAARGSVSPWGASTATSGLARNSSTAFSGAARAGSRP
jgi:3-oxoacyl-(acyl-carrier-protein) synthase